MIKISMRFNFVTKFYVRYRSEEISPPVSPLMIFDIFWLNFSPRKCVHRDKKDFATVPSETVLFPQDPMANKLKPANALWHLHLARTVLISTHCESWRIHRHTGNASLASTEGRSDVWRMYLSAASPKEWVHSTSWQPPHLHQDRRHCPTGHDGHH